MNNTTNNRRNNNNNMKIKYNNKQKNTQLVAECKTMCPNDEFNLRTKNNLVNVLEKKVVKNFKQSSKVNYSLVKEYSRPAAGKIIRSCDLRDIETLMTTTKYLVNEVYNRNDVSYFVKYEYLFDRFRAIRQDLTIQRSNDEDTIKIYEIILAFYILADYKLCTLKNYDAYINTQHLNEVLQSIISSENCSNQSLYYSIFLLLNLKNNQALINILRSSNKELRSTFPFDKAIELFKSFVQKNYIKVYKIYRELPLLCQLAFHSRLPFLELEMFKTMNVSYSSKNLTYPIDHLLEITLVNNKQSLQKYADCSLLTIVDDNQILFSKIKGSELNFKESREPLEFIDDKLSNLIESDFLLDASWI